MTSPTLAAEPTAPEYLAAVTWAGQHDGPILLEGGKKALFAGGSDALSAGVKQSAVFDFDTTKWSDPLTLGTARQLHALTPLPGGKALATGGISAEGGPALATAELFDPETGKWTPVATPMKTARWGHSAVLVGGKVLVAGGSTLRPDGKAVALRSAELFDPAGTGSWATAGEMTDARTGHIAVVLGKKVLVCGGSVPVGTAEDPALAFCELYDSEAAPGTSPWSPAATMRHPRSGHTATALSATSVLVTGGKAPGVTGDGAFDPFARATAEVFDLIGAGGSWKDAKPLPGGRAFHRAVAVDGGAVVVIGGADDLANEAGYRSALRYAAGEWKPLPGLVEGRWGFAAVAAGNTVLVVGGVARSGQAAAGQKTELTKSSEKFGGGS
ncbi:Kelch-like protein 17 [Amycolatopsis sp. WAC 01376]|uniref:Kelch repeat-containing protein n=1 Tax=Amycolatopsis sp. WAC 01376 TaxID=2203195 RepID=UPI000F77D054|nr:kelch repeat-containing protein [Amycolatopsis sp. WAC 01376]RSM57548.1 Kelch-like protein 17 [Amycolatopsis sp. WAC 01376]